MRRFVWKDLPEIARDTALARPQAISDESLIAGVRDILSDVRANGDEAVQRLTQRFDGVESGSLEVPPETLEAAWNALPASDKSVIERARRNIKRFHSAQIQNLSLIHI